MRRTILLFSLLLGACDGRPAAIERACLIFDGGPAQAQDGAAPWRATIAVRYDLTLRQSAGGLSIDGTFVAPQNSGYVIALTPGATVRIGDLREDLGPICGGRAHGYEVRLAATEHAVTITHGTAQARVVFVENEGLRRVGSSGGGDFDFD
jgi:hypothetical protein